MSERAQRVLRQTARFRFGAGRCPVCACTLTPTTDAPHAPTMRTRAHDRSRGRRTSGAFLYWIELCKRCNALQARRTFGEWAHDLACNRDPRAHAVREIAVLFATHAVDSHVACGKVNVSPTEAQL